MGRDIEPYGFVIMGVEPLDCSGSGADANSEFGVRNSEFGMRKQLVLNKGGNWLAVRTARGGFPAFVFIPFDIFIEFYLKLW